MYSCFLACSGVCSHSPMLVEVGQDRMLIVAPIRNTTNKVINLMLMARYCCVLAEICTVCLSIISYWELNETVELLASLSS